MMLLLIVLGAMALLLLLGVAVGHYLQRVAPPEPPIHVDDGRADARIEALHLLRRAASERRPLTDDEWNRYAALMSWERMNP